MKAYYGLAPVVVFGYNRPEHLKRCLEELNKCLGARYTDIYIFIDGPKHSEDIEKVKSVRKIAYDFKEYSLYYKTTILCKEKNVGLANSIIEGVTSIINDYCRAIVVEDDLLVNKYFLKYMNYALRYYKNDKKIWSISGFSYNLKSLEKYKSDVYFIPRGCSTGWATWKNRWETVDWECKDYNSLKYKLLYKWLFTLGGCDLPDMLSRQFNGEIDSWAVRWCYSQAHRLLLTVYPKKSLIENIGYDGSGIHSGNVVINSNKSLFFGKIVRFKKVSVNPIISEEFRRTEGFSYDVYFKQAIKKMLKIGK